MVRPPSTLSGVALGMFRAPQTACSLSLSAQCIALPFIRLTSSQSSVAMPGLSALGRVCAAALTRPEPVSERSVCAALQAGVIKKAAKKTRSVRGCVSHGKGRIGAPPRQHIGVLGA